MPKFLQQNGSEVQNMLFAEWKWEDALRVREKEGEQRGEKRGERRGTLNTLFDLVVRGKLDIDEAASTAKVSQNDFLTELQIQYPNFIPN